MKIPGWLISLGLTATVWIVVRNGLFPVHGLLLDLLLTGIGSVGAPATVYLALDRKAKAKELR